MPKKITRPTSKTKSRKASKPKRSALRDKTIDAYTLAYALADNLDNELGVPADVLHLVADCIADKFDFTSEEHDEFVALVRVNQREPEDGQ